MRCDLIETFGHRTLTHLPPIHPRPDKIPWPSRVVTILSPNPLLPFNLSKI